MTLTGGLKHVHIAGHSSLIILANAVEALDSIAIFGQGGDDIITASDNAWVLPSLVLDGGAGNDILTGGSADDVLVGDLGDDMLYEQEGSDLLIGGPGLDTFPWATAEDIVIDF